MRLARPASGALFAVNMLVNTPGGGTFTFGEMRDDLTSVGFSKVKVLRRGQAMDSVICASKSEISHESTKGTKVWVAWLGFI